MSLENVTVDYHMGTATFMVNMEANSDKTTYKGMFKVKCVLWPREYIEADALYRELLGKTNPQFATDYVSQLCYAMSQLKFRVLDAPAWFTEAKSGIQGGHIDDSILLYVLDRAVEAEDKYRKGIEEMAKKAEEEVKKAYDNGDMNKEPEQEEDDE